jgi:hypothetical protein
LPFSSAFLTSGVIPGLAGDALGSRVGFTSGLDTGLAAGVAVAVGAGVAGLAGVLLLTAGVPEHAPNDAAAAAKTVESTNLLIVISSNIYSVARARAARKLTSIQPDGRHRLSVRTEFFDLHR